MLASQNYVHLVYKSRIMWIGRSQCVEWSWPVILWACSLEQEHGKTKDSKSHKLKNHGPSCDHASMMENRRNRNTADRRKSSEKLRSIFPTASKKVQCEGSQQATPQNIQSSVTSFKFWRTSQSWEWSLIVSTPSKIVCISDSEKHGCFSFCCWWYGPQLFRKAAAAAAAVEQAREPCHCKPSIGKDARVQLWCVLLDH